MPSSPAVPVRAAAKTGDDFVEDRAARRRAGSVDKVLEPRVALRQQPVVGRHRLDDHGREIARQRLEHASIAAFVVERCDERVAQRPRGMPALVAAVGPARPLPARTSMPSAWPW